MRPVQGRWLALVLLAAAGVPTAVPGCAGRSTDGDRGAGSGATNGTDATAGAGGSGRGGTQGNAGDASGGGDRAGSTGNSGRDGSAGTLASPDDCVVDGQPVPDGARWMEDCNTCWCERSKVDCTLLACGGTGGSVGTGGAPAGGASSGGAAGAACSEATIGSFCVMGIPINSGDQLKVGMPLHLTLRPTGCHSSSCTQVESSWCNYIGSDGNYWISGALCLRQEGDACTEDCGGGSVQCDAGVTLSAGVNTVWLAGTDLKVTFTVPSVATADELCTSIAEP